MRTRGTRRNFLTVVLPGSTLVCRLARANPQLEAPRRSAAEPLYELLIKGGHVVDPAQQLSARRDVALAAGRVARVAENIPEQQASRVMDARGKYVTPGLIDVHVHVYEGVAPLAVPADPNCVAKGVTTVVDAGSSGAHTFPGFRKYVIDRVDTRVYALLNIAVAGQSMNSPVNPHGELLDLRYANPRAAVKTIERHRDVILGVKIRLTDSITGPNDLEALKLAREAAEAAGLPMMVHIGNPYSPVANIMPLLRKNDVITHCFRGDLLDGRGRLIANVRAALERGVQLDVGHGAGGFSFETAEKAMRQGVLPGTISSDLHHGNLMGPVFDLATTLSKFLVLGMTLEQVIERATSNPARTFRFPPGLGSLREGSPADIAVFSLEEGRFEFADTRRVKRTGGRKLVPEATVKAGRLYGAAMIPVTGF